MPNGTSPRRMRVGSVHRSTPPPTWTPRSMRLNAASWRRSISTGARCSSAAMMAICSARTAGGVPRFRRRPHACRPGRASRGCSRSSWPASWSASRAPTSCRTASTARACVASTSSRLVVVPLSLAQRIVGVVSFGVTRSERQWPPEILQRLRLAASMFASVLARRQSDEALAPGARRSGAPERSAARGERVSAP